MQVNSKSSGTNWRCIVSKNLSYSNFRYSSISPGWQSRALHIAIKVETLIAFALPVFRIDIFASVMPTFSASSVTLIFRFASITSILNIKVPFISSITIASFRSYCQVVFVLKDGCFFKESRYCSHAYSKSNSYYADEG